MTELDEADVLDEGLTPGGEIVSEELIVQVIPQGKDEWERLLAPLRIKFGRIRNGALQGFLWSRAQRRAALRHL